MSSQYAQKICSVPEELDDKSGEGGRRVTQAERHIAPLEMAERCLSLLPGWNIRWHARRSYQHFALERSSVACSLATSRAWRSRSRVPRMNPITFCLAPRMSVSCSHVVLRSDHSQVSPLALRGSRKKTHGKAVLGTYLLVTAASTSRCG